MNLAYVLLKRWLYEWLCPGNAGGTYGGVRDGCGNQKADKLNEDGMEDVYAIGLQEFVDLNAVNVTIDTKSQVTQQFLPVTTLIDAADCMACDFKISHKTRARS